MTVQKKYFATILFKFDGKTVFHNLIMSFEDNKITLDAINNYLKEYKEDYGADEAVFIGMIPLED